MELVPMAHGILSTSEIRLKKHRQHILKNILQQKNKNLQMKNQLKIESRLITHQKVHFKSTLMLIR